MPTLRGAYLVALGLEPLVLRGAVGAAGDGSVISGAAAAAAGEPSTAMRARDAAAVSQPRHARSGTEPHADVPSEARLPVDMVADDGLFGPRPARICLLVADEADFSGPHGRLLRAVVQALGVAAAEASFDARDGVPAIAFGAAAIDAAVVAPALSELRGAQAKRAAWPALRRLRRTLRSGA